MYLGSNIYIVISRVTAIGGNGSAFLPHTMCERVAVPLSSYSMNGNHYMLWRDTVHTTIYVTIPIN